MRAGWWGFAFDLDGTRFQPKFPVTAHWLCSIFIQFSVWKCVWFSLFFFFLTARRICVFLGFCLSLSCTAISVFCAVVN